MRTEQILEREANNPSHAYLFIGSQTIVQASVLDFVKKLGTSVADLHILDCSEKVKIEQIRNLQHEVNLRSYDSAYKIAVVQNASQLTPESSNALLKTLEEPPKHSIIILVTRDEKDLLPTIVSRCRRIKINKTVQINYSDENKNTLLSVGRMSIKQKFDLADKLSKDEKLPGILDDWTLVLREEIERKDSRELIKEINKSKKALFRNVNVRLLLENLFLEI